MIRRGLQTIVLVGITALGAAPCFAQLFGSSLHIFAGPSFPPDNELGYGPVTFDGTYVLQGVGYDGYTVYTKDVGDGWNVEVHAGGVLSGESGWIENTQVKAFGPEGTVVLGWNGSNWEVQQNDTGLPMDTGGMTLVGSNGIRLGLSGASSTGLDWTVARWFLPAGFAFGLACWASLYAMAVPFKWVREIANAAT